MKLEDRHTPRLYTNTYGVTASPSTNKLETSSTKIITKITNQSQHCLTARKHGRTNTKLRPGYAKLIRMGTQLTPIQWSQLIYRSEH